MRAVFKTMFKLKNELGLKVTTALSRAGLEVARLYGILDSLSIISPGGYYEEIFVDDPLRPVSRIPGRVMAGCYDVVVLAPATANTVAKIVRGIADTIVSQAFSMALKSGTPVVILPSDHSKVVEAEMPCLIDPETCRACPECPPEISCPHGAILRSEDGKAHIDMASCRGCEACVSSCPHGAISCWKRIEVRCREVDLANVRELEVIGGVEVVKDEVQLYHVLRRLLSG